MPNAPSAKSMIKKLHHFSKAVTKSFRNDYYHQPGTLPGTLIIDENAEFPTIFLIDYNQDSFIRKQVEAPEECLDYLDSESVSWVDLQGLGNQDILQRMGRVFDLHPLVLEDVVNMVERPKIEDYEDQLLFIARMVVPKERTFGFYSEQVSFWTLDKKKIVRE
jgi:magnesium transporter